jgi:hypothetical protein
VRVIQGAWSALVQRCGAPHFNLNEAVRNSALALHSSPKSPTRAGLGPGPRAPPPRSSRIIAGSWSWGRGKPQELSLSHRGLVVSCRCPVASSIKRCAFGRQCVITQCPFSASIWQRPTHSKQPSEPGQRQREANLALQFPSACPLDPLDATSTLRDGAALHLTGPFSYQHVLPVSHRAVSHISMCFLCHTGPFSQWVGSSWAMGADVVSA